MRRLIKENLFPLIQAVWAAGAGLLGRMRHAHGDVRSWEAQGEDHVMIVAPHPDDETLGAGGVAALHVHRGDQVTMVVVTDGGASRAGGWSRAEMIHRRREEVTAAAAELGIRDLIWLGLREGEWDEKQFRAALAPLLAQASILYAPSCIDYHPEHVRVARTLADLVRPGQIVRIFEIGVPLTPLLVNVIADIREVAAMKERALEKFATQAGALAAPRRLAGYRSKCYRLPAVEVFWEMTAEAYVRVMHAGDWRKGRCPFRGLRERPATDPLSAFAGAKARKALRRLAENAQDQNMKSKRRVVFLVPGFPKDEHDDACIPLLQNYVLYFSRANPAIAIAVIAFQYPYFVGRYEWNGIPVYSAGGKNKRRVFRFLTWLRAASYFLRVRRQGHIAVVHSFWLDECTFVGQWLARIFSIRHVATIGGQDAKAANRYLGRLDFSRLILTCWSRFSAEAFQSATGWKVEKIIPIGLDDKRLATIPLARERTIDILGVGALIPLKNFELFVEIIFCLSQEFPGLRAKIIGEGPQFQHVQQLIRIKCQNHLELLGKLPRRQVIDSMAHSKILLHTSTFESQGYVFMEALYCGMTVVSFDVGYLGQTKKVIKCLRPDDMIANLRILLTGPLDFDRVLLKPIEETADEFKCVYEL